MGCGGSKESSGAEETAGGSNGLPPQAQEQGSSLPDPPQSSSLLSEAHPRMPPGRVRALWKKLDKDKDGFLTLDELLQGFDGHFNGDALSTAETDNLKATFAAHATEQPSFLIGKKQLLSAKVFSRFYAEVLFRHFDANGNRSLQLAEVQRALAFLVKPDEAGNAAPPCIAYPPEFTLPSGEVELPFSWFWFTFRAMD